MIDELQKSTKVSYVHLLSTGEKRPSQTVAHKIILQSILVISIFKFALSIL